MTKLERQRFEDDCTLCCIAMATGFSYERVLATAVMTPRGYLPGKGTYSVPNICFELGVECRSYWPESLTLRKELTAWGWGRRAIFSVPSLNGWAGHHDVYWDGAHLFDPTPKQAYPDDLRPLEPRGIVLFNERGGL